MTMNLTWADTIQALHWQQPDNDGVSSAADVERLLRGYPPPGDLQALGPLIDACYPGAGHGRYISLRDKHAERWIEADERAACSAQCCVPGYQRLLQLWFELSLCGPSEITVRLPFGSRGCGLGLAFLRALYAPELSDRPATVRSVCFQSRLGLSRHEARLLAHGLASHCGVRRLSFVSSGRLWPDVFAGLATNRALRELLIFAPESIARAHDLFAAVASSPALHTFKLMACSLDPAASLAPLLAPSSRLGALDLSRLAVTPAQLDGLFAALRHQHTLYSLNLSNCNVDDAAFARLCAALTTNDALHYLQLANNRVAQLEPVFRLLSYNRTLISCSLIGNPAHDTPSAEALTKLLLVRKQNIQRIDTTLLSTLINALR